MKKRPWQILLLAAMHALSPISAFFIGAWRMDLSPWAYSLFLRSEDSWTLVQHFALYPLGGLAIYSMKRWSYLVFLSVMAWSFWKHSQMGLPVIRLALVYSINLGLVTYFMIPAVRRAYFDSRIKWWESQTRYEFSVPAIVRGSDGQDHPIALLDFSQGGVFARWDSEKSAPEAQTRLRIEVSLGGDLLRVPGHRDAPEGFATSRLGRALRLSKLARTAPGRAFRFCAEDPGRPQEIPQRRFRKPSSRDSRGVRSLSQDWQGIGPSRSLFSSRGCFQESRQWRGSLIKT